MLDLREGLGKLCARAERCLGHRYSTRHVQLMAPGLFVTKKLSEEYRDCGNFTRNGNLNDQHPYLRLLEGHAANSIFSDRLVRDKLASC